MGFVNSFKRDIARHRQKAAVLAILMSLMLFMCVRAAFQLRPQTAAAATDSMPTDLAAAGATSAGDSAEAEDRIRLSKELWRRLLEKRGMTLTELGDRLGMTLANLSILKTNKARAIRFSTLDALCQELRCQPGDLLEWVPEPEGEKEHL